MKFIDYVEVLKPLNPYTAKDYEEIVELWNKMRQLAVANRCIVITAVSPKRPLTNRRSRI